MKAEYGENSKWIEPVYKFIKEKLSPSSQDAPNSETIDFEMLKFFHNVEYAITSTIGITEFGLMIAAGSGSNILENLLPK
jgi:hypothetical protein